MPEQPAPQHNEVSHTWSYENVRGMGIAAILRTTTKRPDGEPEQVELLRQLEPTVEANLNEHLRTREFWVPRNYMPIDEHGQIEPFVEPGEDSYLSPEAKAAMVVNLLTEDNLPGYHNAVVTNFGMDAPWGNWVNTWTAEEARHAYVLRAYLDLTGAVDTEDLERKRLAHMERGVDVSDKSPLHALVYVSFQELATRISHYNTGLATKEENALKILKRIAKDENKHMVFYRNIVAEAFNVAPNQTMRAVADEVIHFAMPGAGMDDFIGQSLLIARAGIYDLRQHKKDVLRPILNYWKVFERTGLSAEGEQARQELADFYEGELDKRIDLFEGKRDTGKIDQIIARRLGSDAVSSFVQP
jgi:acyl-[acyl-carrier-protein] desaturase